MSRDSDVNFLNIAQTAFVKAANAKNQGFTLLEVLVVMLLIGIVLSFATLSVNLGSPDDPVRKEARRLQGLLTLAQEEALLNNRVLGIAMSNAGYGFYVLYENEWQQIDDEFLRWRELPAEMKLELELEAVPLALKNEVPKQPQILLLPDGEVTAFICVFRQMREDVAYQLSVTLLGEGQLSRLE